MSKGYWQTYSGQALLAATDLDRAADRDPLADDSAQAMFSETYLQLCENGESPDVAAWLAAIAAGVYDPSADSCYY